MAKVSELHPAAQRTGLYPHELEHRWGRGSVTIWRMQRDGRLPPRDWFIGGKAVGWRISTIEALESGKAA